MRRRETDCRASDVGHWFGMTTLWQSEDRRVTGRGRRGGEGRGARMIGKKGEEDGVVYGDAQREAEGVPEV